MRLAKLQIMLQKGLSFYSQHWWSFTSSTGCSFRLHNTRRIGNKDSEKTRWHEDQRILGLFNLEKRRLRDELIAVYNFLMRGSGEGGADLFSDRT